MTQEEKAKAYDEALERAKGIYKETWNSYILKIFPELKESEDEKIRKELIEHIKANECADYVLFQKFSPDNVIDWLEKQGEHKPIDKVEPKFKVGDFVVNGYCFGKVIEITNDAYLLDTGQGIPFSCEHNAHLWTIEDAKEGDVLTSIWKGCSYIYIFKEVENNIIISHIFYYPELDAIDMGVINMDNTPTFPATKAQRDILFAKMHEAGYEWDAEKKELRRIEL